MYNTMQHMQNFIKLTNIKKFRIQQTIQAVNT